MPQVRCPNCGTTINLETRKETDFNLIIDSLQKNPKTFTQLLNQTRLPRKTLSLRLNELCHSGIIIKNGGYCLSDSYPRKKLWGEKMSTLYGDIRKSLLYSKKNALLLLILLSVGLPVAVKAYTMISPQILEPPAPKYVGTLTMALKVNNVIDLCVWQVNMSFNPSELLVLDVQQGDFFKGPNALITIPLEEANKNGVLLLGGSQLGPGPGEGGSGTLALITFGVKQKGTYDNPEIIFGGEDGFGFGTFIEHSNLEPVYNVKHLLELEPFS